MKSANSKKNHKNKAKRAKTKAKKSTKTKVKTKVKNDQHQDHIRLAVVTFNIMNYNSARMAMRPRKDSNKADAIYETFRSLDPNIRAEIMSTKIYHLWGSTHVAIALQEVTPDILNKLKEFIQGDQIHFGDFTKDSHPECVVIIVPNTFRILDRHMVQHNEKSFPLVVAQHIEYPNQMVVFGSFHIHHATTEKIDAIKKIHSFCVENRIDQYPTIFAGDCNELPEHMAIDEYNTYHTNEPTGVIPSRSRYGASDMIFMSKGVLANPTSTTICTSLTEYNWAVESPTLIDSAKIENAEELVRIAQLLYNNSDHAAVMNDTITIINRLKA